MQAVVAVWDLPLAAVPVALTADNFVGLPRVGAVRGAGGEVPGMELAVAVAYATPPAAAPRPPAAGVPSVVAPTSLPAVAAAAAVAAVAAAAAAASMDSPWPVVDTPPAAASAQAPAPPSGESPTRPTRLEVMPPVDVAAATVVP
ncbi:hypothetical protein I4F81_004311 [Pyropia yezoensis]|uniref:Uncharacterized protein n=1 Tax=Pyropia yezoensis TaxID=2788 RepID=A0ACC3BVM9_PYRYE|nr:hypothetical protein I4F81_004311 [Neopyropia yezoensis]